jgi:hypothetical protein
MAKVRLINLRCVHLDFEAVDERPRSLLSELYRAGFSIANSLLFICTFAIVGLWLSGAGTGSGFFDGGEFLVPDTARALIWQNGLQLTSNSPTGEEVMGHQGMALLKPDVANLKVPTIAHLSDRIPISKLDPLAVDSNLLASIANQTAVSEYFANKYSLDRQKMDEYISNAVVVGKEVKIDPILLMAIMSIESNFNPNLRSSAGAEGLMQVMTAIHLDKYLPYGGASQAARPEVNIRIGAYILKYFIAQTGSLENGLRSYVGAGASGEDGGYIDKVLKERDQLIGICRSKSKRTFLES